MKHPIQAQGSEVTPTKTKKLKIPSRGILHVLPARKKLMKESHRTNEKSNNASKPHERIHIR